MPIVSCTITRTAKRILRVFGQISEASLSALGLGELFDAFGNPLPLLSGDGTPAYIGKAEQGTAISIDEIGCEAASYVKIEVDAGADMPPEDLVQMYLTRPFVFAILSENDVPPVPWCDQ